MSGVCSPHAVGLKMDPSLVKYSDKFCTTITPAHLVGRTECRPKVLWLGWCPNPTAESITKYGYRRWLVQTSYPPLLGALARLAFVDSREFPHYSQNDPVLVRVSVAVERYHDHSNS